MGDIIETIVSKKLGRIREIFELNRRHMSPADALEMDALLHDATVMLHHVVDTLHQQREYMEHRHVD